MPSDETIQEHRDDPTESDPAPQTGAVAADADDPDTGSVDEPPTSPVLEHLDETMNRAQQAADKALAPQRD